MPRRYLYLIRNGHYAREDEGDGSLTEFGKRQVQLTTQALQGFPFRAIHYSPHQQVRETALAFAQAFQISDYETELLRQYNEQLKFGTLSRSMLMTAHTVQQQQLDAAVLQFITPPDSDQDWQEIIVCHANIIRDLICKALGVNPSTWAHMLINHCGISCLSVDEQATVELLSYNDVNHLPNSLHTES
jgi:serine/threonine-protein phosphatase PGAM5